MREIYVIFVVLLIVSSMSQTVDPHYNYDDFARQFNRNYTGAEKS